MVVSDGASGRVNTGEGSGGSPAVSEASVMLRSQVCCFRNQSEGKDSVLLHSSSPPA